LASGLFHRAIPQSGAAHTIHHVDQAAETSRLIANILGLKSVNELTTSYLRTLPIAKLLQAQMDLIFQFMGKPSMTTYLKGQVMPFQPVVAGPVFGGGISPYEAIQNGIARNIPVLTGTILEEFRLFMMTSMGERSLARTKKTLTHYLNNDLLFHGPTTEEEAGRVADSLLQRLHQLSPGDQEHLFCRMQSDWQFDVPMWRLIDAQTKNNKNVYVYSFQWESGLPQLKACHALELPFMFGSLKANPMIERFADAKNPKAMELSELMVEMWANFARTGVPSSEKSSVKWLPYERSTRPVMIFGRNGGQPSGGCVLEMGFRASSIQVWEGVKDSLKSGGLRSKL